MVETDRVELSWRTSPGGFTVRSRSLRVYVSAKMEQVARIELA